MENHLHRIRFVLLGLGLAVVALAGCQQGGPATSAPAGAPAPAAAAPRRAEVAISAQFRVCLRLPDGARVEGQRSTTDADTATLRRAAGDIGIYVGEHPDFPGFRAATRHASDEATPSFQAIADVSRNGRRNVLVGHKRAADQPRLYVMFSGAESAFAGGGLPTAADVVDCNPSGDGLR